ncbi:hypothetical protein LTR37_016421 [Vermiconidia calcicola]|uniref:Uncharacterized protein n=1 Tax=Vermiconidia calcicola TaxID=1690605 RepID=A0ACC3MMS7_9PEZI|nr:hypothetical protein LTR37_016421 [Vermiconidia calcicola]
MSNNVTITLPLDMVVAIHKATTSRTKINAIAKASQAIIDAVDAVPYDIKKKGVAPTSSEDGAGGRYIKVNVSTLTGRRYYFKINTHSRASDLAAAMWDTSGIPTDQQLLIHEGKKIHYDGDPDGIIDQTLDTLGIRDDGATIYLVVKLRGS